MLTVGSLFSGIGGLELGLERAGMVVRWQVENDPYCIKVLKKRWPDVKRYVDITTYSPIEFEEVDLICGGFPCQPVSVAGKRLYDEDDRWLWPEFLKTIRTLGPKYALIENVSGLLVRGMHGILCDLASIGYDAEWESLPASAFGAPHRRDRVFIMAYRDHRHLKPELQIQTGGNTTIFSGSDVSDPASKRLHEPSRSETKKGSSDERPEHTGELSGRPEGHRSLPDTDPGGRDRGPGRIRQANRGAESEDGCSCRGQQWACCRTHEDDRLARSGIRRISHGVPKRVDRLRCLGNAVVPQVADYIGRLLLSRPF